MTHDRHPGLTRSLRRLSRILGDIARTAESRSPHRCPHYDARRRCRYPGDCTHQIHATETACRVRGFERAP